MKKNLVMVSPFVAAALSPVDGGAVPMSEDRRRELLALAKADQLESLSFAADVFVARYPNRNFFRFRDAELKKLARSFKGMPFLRDHGGAGLFSPPSTVTRGGTIRSGEVAAGDPPAIAVTVDVVKSWAQVGVLDGTLDRFSIGWRSRAYECTIDGRDFGEDGHEHVPGETYDGQLCEVLCLDPEGVEVSAVVTPAVPGTRVTEVMAASEDGAVAVTGADLKKLLDASGMVPRRGETTREEDMDLERLKKILGLPATASEGEVFAALDQRLSEHTVLRASLTAALGLPEAASRDDVVGKVVGLTAPGAFVPRAEHDAVVAKANELERAGLLERARKAGKIAPSMVAWAEEWSKKDLAAFRAWEANAPVLVPLAPAGGAQPLSTVATEEKVDADERAVFHKMGLRSEEEIRYAKQMSVYDAAADEEVPVPAAWRPKTNPIITLATANEGRG